MIRFNNYKLMFFCVYFSLSSVRLSVPVQLIARETHLLYYAKTSVMRYAYL